MFPWFVWNGIDSRDMRLWITALPPIIRAKERTQEIKIPGRAGSLTMTEGGHVYDSYLKNCVVTVDRRTDLQPVLAWLCGEGRVIFSNEENRVYRARIAGEVAFDRISNTLAQATIPFFVQPLKEQYPKETTIVKTGEETTIENPGDTESRPLVTVDYEGSIEITIGDNVMTFTNLTAPIIVDCDAEIITEEDGTIWNGQYSGDFWRIPKGLSAITMSNGSCTLYITPEWRWV